MKQYMENFTKVFFEKITSYNLFNNLLPGIIFCYVVERVTTISFTGDSVWENFFVFYFLGVVIGRISSLFIEPWLINLKLKNKQTKTKESYIKFAPYNEFVEASRRDPFIKTLNESCNMYRSFISTFLLVACCKIYDGFIREWICRLGHIGDNIKGIVICLLIACLFTMSYKKQVDYIRKRVEKCVKDSDLTKGEMHG